MRGNLHMGRKAHPSGGFYVSDPPLAERLPMKKRVKISLLVLAVIAVLAAGFFEFSQYEHQKLVEAVSQAKEEAQIQQQGSQQKINNLQQQDQAAAAQQQAQQQASQQAINQLQAAQQQAQAQAQASQQTINNLQTDNQSLLQSDKQNEIDQIVQIGNTLQDYYNEIRAAYGLGSPSGSSLCPWSSQCEVDFWASLAQNALGTNYWPQYETKYHSLTNSYSYVDANKELYNATFVAYAGGIGPGDSDILKIEKILDFVDSQVKYENDMSETPRAPAETLSLKSGDCKDYSILVSAMLAEAGLKTAVMRVSNANGSQSHAMVLVQSNENLPLDEYYSDLTNGGLIAGKWWVIEPQYPFAQQTQHPDWFAQWHIENVAAVAPAAPKENTNMSSGAVACLMAGTRILMADGSYKKIEEIKIGDQVISWDKQIEKRISATVQAVVQRQDPIITINGALRAAPDEVVFLANGGAAMAGNLSLGDQLLDENNNPVIVKSIDYSGAEKTYDLSLSNADSFYAGGYLVHDLPLGPVPNF